MPIYKGHKPGGANQQELQVLEKRRPFAFEHVADELPDPGHDENRHRDLPHRPGCDCFHQDRQPQQELLRLRYPVETPVARSIIRHGVVRLAYTDPDEAMRLWETFKERYEFFGEDEKYVLRWVGVLAAQAHHPRAVEWLSAASADVGDETLRQWRVRAAIRNGEWQTGLRFLALLPEPEQKEGEWRYWKARMLERSGEEKQAKILYRELAKEVSGGAPQRAR